MRVRATIAYDGSNYCGWQIQKNAGTIQGVVDQCLSQLLGESIHCLGASRTDAGVHSMGNEILFETSTRMPAEKIAYALNQRLPEDIVCQGSREAEADFHPRYSDSYKSYVYQICNRHFPMPTMRRDSYFYHYDLDVAQMQAAADLLLGEQDFTSFSSLHAQTKTRVRQLYEAKVTREERGIVRIQLTGNGFLYNMVRIIAGTLIQVGSGQRQPDEIRSILAAKDREQAGPTAPACGLTQLGIHYLSHEEIAARDAGIPWPFIIDKGSQ